MTEMPRKPKVGDHIIIADGLGYGGPFKIMSNSRKVEVISVAPSILQYEPPSNYTDSVFFDEYGKTWRFADETPALDFQDYSALSLADKILAPDADGVIFDTRRFHERLDSRDAPERKPRELTDNEIESIHFEYQDNPCCDGLRALIAAYEAMRPELLEGGQ